ncbi:unnamed protein product [Callosobruchus maculatus]|uniref:Uncharacterized protein n=1 Tax=Callosobruchus maculatus TaxID=64391 RepID=A0A653CS36_CALMS|nr:unnamed protein product [Callosobruchus maculatus]
MNKSCSESALHMSSEVENESFCKPSDSKTRFPYQKALYMEETFNNTYGTVRRYASCTEFKGHGSSDICDINTLFSTHVKLNSPPGKQQQYIDKHHLNDETWEVVPMDVDISDDKLTTTINKKDNQKMVPAYIDLTNESTVFDEMDTKYIPKLAYSTDFDTMVVKPSKSQLKPYSEKNQVKSNLLYITSKKNESSMFPVLSVLSVLISLAVYLYFYNFTSVNSDIQIQNIKQDLLAQVYEQEKVVNTIIQVLEQRRYWKSKVKVLGFVGPQGVGKTHIVNILRKHFPRNLVHDLYGPYIGYKSQRDKIMEAIDSCCLNLVVIDDMRREDDIELFSFIHSLQKTAFILVIPIFNLQSYDDSSSSTIDRQYVIKLRNSFDDSGLNYELLKFNEFSDDQVENWLKQQLKTQNIHPDYQDTMIQEILLEHNAKYQGLKGLTKKMMLEIEKIK